MSGSGNDFILIDNRDGVLRGIDLPGWVSKVCRRGLSVGADGVITIEPSKTATFKWHYYNADGGEVSMCGNGSRCAARFAVLEKIAPPQLTIETLAGIIRAEVEGDRVKVQLTRPKDYRPGLAVPIAGKTWEGHFIDTGVPHVVYSVDNVEKTDVLGLGRATREHAMFKPAGTNANFIRVVDPHTIAIRTYERGVESETLACGTGAVAAALISGARGEAQSPVTLKTRGGQDLTVFFETDGEAFTNVFLEGEARVIYTAELSPEALAG